MSAKPDYDAIIVGAGVSGLCSAIQMEKRLGLTNTLILERAEQVGGTWWNNQYPGCGCDVPTRLYSLSFAQKKTWKQFFPLQPELYEYFTDVAKQFRLNERIAFRTEGQKAYWNKSTGLWEVQYQSIVEDAAGNRPAPVVKTARFLVSGMGALSVPREIGIKGAEKFKGPIFHSAQWRKDVDLTNKNVVLVGNGCSATQIVPKIAPIVKHLTQVVRSKHWVSPQLNVFFARYTFLQRWLPGWALFERWLIAVVAESQFLQADKYYGQGARDRYAAVCKKYITQYAPKQYHSMLLPTNAEVPVACKRRVFDDGYIPSLNRNNVTLTNNQAVEITEDAVILKDGTTVPADVIVHANGFKTETFSLQMDIVGEQKSLAQYWKDTKVPQAYRGTCVNTFPNLFIIWGPNTVTGHFSAIWTIECCVDLMCTILKPVVEATRDLPATKALPSVQVSKAAEEKEQRYIHTQMQTKIYTAGCGAWYTDPETGKVTALAPCSQYTWQTRCRYPVLSDFEYKGVEGVKNFSPYNYVSAWKRLNMLLGRGDVFDSAAESSLQKLRRVIANVIQMRLYQLFSFIVDIVIQWKWPARQHLASASAKRID